VKQHVCVDCRKLPEAERPVTPRPIVEGDGPRSGRCATHKRAKRKRQAQRVRASRVLRTFGLAPDRFAALWALQGEKCAICARRPSRSPDVDHDHACCDSRESCGQCVRGLVCRWCNTELLIRIDLAAARRLVAYYEDSPMARLRRAEDLEDAS
jgi:hypothetical protein